MTSIAERTKIIDGLDFTNFGIGGLLPTLDFIEIIIFKFQLEKLHILNFVKDNEPYTMESYRFAFLVYNYINPLIM